MKRLVLVMLAMVVVATNLFIYYPQKVSAALCGPGYHNIFTFQISDIFIHQKVSRLWFQDNDYLVTTLTVEGNAPIQHQYALGQLRVGNDYSFSGIKSSIALHGTPCYLSPKKVAFSYQIVNASSATSQAVFNQSMEIGKELGIAFVVDGVKTEDAWEAALGLGTIAGVVITDNYITSNYCGATVALDQVSGTLGSFWHGSAPRTVNYQRPSPRFFCQASSYDVTWSAVHTLTL
jgi:hypothetical protein